MRIASRLMRGTYLPRLRLLIPFVFTLALIYWLSSLLVNSIIATVMSVVYALVLCAVLKHVKRRSSMLVIVAYLITLCLAVDAAYYRLRPHTTIKISDVAGWLSKELKPGADRSAVIGFIERHKAAHQAVRSFRKDSETYIVVTYMNYDDLISCSPDVEVIFELSEADHLMSYDVAERQSCS
jgi:FlaA1/EpsC-like NDP-sugar epimerase